jgi:AraC-like DNA-binding protein
MLSSTSYTVAHVAAEVGYESEAAFNRAFKREFTIPPARFRSQSRSGSGEADMARKSSTASKDQHTAKSRGL